MKRGKLNITHDGPVFIVAELSANHGGRIETAIETVRAAKRAGADAIKLQTYTPDTITLDVKTDVFRVNGNTIWDGQYLYDLYKEAFLPWEWHAKIFEVAAEQGLYCFSSPFDKTAVDFLEQFDPPAYKIASLEITDIPLIEYVASLGKPIIFSTGIAEMEDIELAVSAARKAGNDQIVILKCTTSYPAPLEEANLASIPDMRNRFGVEVGLSDHTMGFVAPVVAASLGARLIEKHFILDKSVGGPDASFSLDEAEFREMVNAVRDAEKTIGVVTYEVSEKVKPSVRFRRSLFVAADMKEGDTITDENVKSVRPGDGLHPKYYASVLGKRVKRDLAKGHPLSLDDIE